MPLAHPVLAMARPSWHQDNAVSFPPSLTEISQMPSGHKLLNRGQEDKVGAIFFFSFFLFSRRYVDRSDLKVSVSCFFLTLFCFSCKAL